MRVPSVSRLAVSRLAVSRLAVSRLAMSRLAASVAVLGLMLSAPALAADAGAPVLLAQAETAITPAATVPEPLGTVDVAKLMAGQPLPDIVIGKADAPVTIVEYASMTCGHCAAFHKNSYPAVKRDYVDTGKAKIILREFPFDPRALAAFMLARCTGDDARRTAMVDTLFDQQAEWAQAQNASVALLGIARLAGMSQEQFTACLSDKALQEKVVAVQERGQNEFGVSATPTFFINGDRYSGDMAPETVAAVIEKHLAAPAR